MLQNPALMELGLHKTFILQSSWDVCLHRSLADIRCCMHRLHIVAGEIMAESKQEISKLFKLHYTILHNSRSMRVILFIMG